MLDTKVKAWYTETHKSDKNGKKLNSLVTFKDVYNTLEDCQDFYKLIGVEDTVIRVRVFEQLSKITGMSYSEVFEKWVKV